MVQVSHQWCGKGKALFHLEIRSYYIQQHVCTYLLMHVCVYKNSSFIVWMYLKVGLEFVVIDLLGVSITGRS